MKPTIIDVEIAPNTVALTRLGATGSDFTAALDAALSALAGRRIDQLPRAGDIPIRIAGVEQRLGDLAAIRVQLG